MKIKDDVLLEQAYAEILLKENEGMHTISSIPNNIKENLLNSLEKYLKEGEHQDGEGFYSNYKTAGELAEDFARHLNSLA